MRNALNGILLLDKPINFTSNGALQRVKRLFKAKKAGHTGSLDPIATGMLPICFGEATKFSQFLLTSDKAYSVTAKLGVQTTTGDSEGEITCIKPVAKLTGELVQAVLSQFKGEIEQIPPMFSAIKYQGKPLYKLARRGIEVARQARKISIYAIDLLDITPENELTIAVHCSKGTYIRTLIEDIGLQLGCGAHVISLRRTVVHPYSNAFMYSLPMLEKRAQDLGLSALFKTLLPIETAVQSYPAITLSTAAAFYLRAGQAVRTSIAEHAQLVRLFSEDERFLGIGMVMPDGRVQPQRLVNWQ